MVREVLLLLMLLISLAQAKITLRHLSTDYIPSAYNGEEEIFQYNVDAAEQLAYDTQEPYIYTVGLNLIHVLDYSNPENIHRVYHYQVPAEGSLSDVETCGDLVAVSFDDAQYPLSGKVYLFSRYDGTSMELLQAVVVGAVPDCVKFTSNCSQLVVAVEGEVRQVNGEVVDPEGEVVFLRFTNGNADYIFYKTDFQEFNDREEEYTAKGVRRVWHGQNAGITTTFSQDLEPEYIAISEEDNRVHVVLQENNAVATFDLITKEVIDLYPLGFKHWQPDTIDPSDEDGGIQLGNWDVYGMHQPDGLKLITIAGTQYLITADEGDDKEYTVEEHGFDWAEVSRGKHLESDGYLDDSVPDDVRALLDDDAALGRLQMSTVDGLVPETGKVDTFYCYGGRSFSIYDVNQNFDQVYTSQDMLEVEIASQYPTIFNSNPKSNDERPEEAMDTRSDNRGPEPQALDFAELDFGGATKKVIVLGIERPGFIALFTMEDDFVSTETLTLESLHYNGGYGNTYENLWSSRVARDLDCEDVKILPANSSHAGYHLLAVSGAVSGTVSLYEIYDDDDDETEEHNGEKIHDVSQDGKTVEESKGNDITVLESETGQSGETPSDKKANDKISLSKLFTNKTKKVK